MKKILVTMLCVAMLMTCIPVAMASGYTFSVNHSASLNHPYQRGCEFFKEKLEEYSGGSLSLDIYPSNQLASGSKAVEGVALGTIDIFVENPMSVCNIVPSFEAQNLPYLFDSAEQAFAILDHEACKVFYDNCEENNIKLLGYWYNGWRNVSNSKRPIEKLDDLLGLTIRIAESAVYADMMAALGMNAVPLANSEIFTALQMGTVDAQENPQNNYINNKYYEVNRFFAMTRHVFCVEPVGMNLDLWNSLTEKEQEIVMKAFNEATIYQRQDAQTTEENQLKTKLDEGADIVVSYISDLTPFREAVNGVYDLARGGKYDKNGVKLSMYMDALETARAAVDAAQ